MFNPKITDSGMPTPRWACTSNQEVDCPLIGANALLKLCQLQRWEKTHKCANLDLLRVSFRHDPGRVSDAKSALSGLEELCQALAEKEGSELSVHALLNGRPAAQTSKRRAITNLGLAFPTYYGARVK